MMMVVVVEAVVVVVALEVVNAWLVDRLISLPVATKKNLKQSSL